jgi:hypothetical protein
MGFKHQFTVAIAAVGFTLAGAYGAWAEEAGSPQGIILVKQGGGGHGGGGHGGGGISHGGGIGYGSFGRGGGMSHQGMGHQGMAMSHGRGHRMHSSGHNFRRGYYDDDGDFTFFPIYGNIYADGDSNCYLTCRQSHGPRFCRAYASSYCDD